MNVSFLFGVGSILFVGLLDTGEGKTVDDFRSRHEFAKAMNEIKEGMSKNEVIGRLGPPDDIRTEHDGRGISTTGTNEILRYGTSGHLTTATLGQIYIKDNDQVQYIFGTGTPPPEDMFTESELRSLLNIMGRLQSYNDGYKFNPRHLICAVNVLQPLGKEKALAAIVEYLRVSSRWHDSESREGVFLLLRALFQVPADPGYMPRMHVGQFFQENFANPRVLPRYPIVIERGIPLLLVSGAILAGAAEQPESHIEYFSKHGILSNEPLVPSDDPFKTLRELESSPRWLFRGLDGAAGRRYASMQLLRLMNTVYPSTWEDVCVDFDKEDQHFRRLFAEASALKIKWDKARCHYVFEDGTFLPETPTKNYRREIWKPFTGDSSIKIILARDNPSEVTLTITEEWTTRRLNVTSCRVVDSNAMDQVIHTWNDKSVAVETGKGFAQTEGRTLSHVTRTERFELPENTETRVELIVDGKVERSPILKP